MIQKKDTRVDEVKLANKHNKSISKNKNKQSGFTQIQNFRWYNIEEGFLQKGI